MIIFDLDGTLANCEHRRHYVDKSYITCGIGCSSKRRCIKCLRKLELDQPNWKAFYEACDQDKPILPVMEALRKFGNCPQHEIMIWSGRCESVKEKTIDWLYKYSPYHAPKDVWRNFLLKMRPIGDYTPDDQLKERWLDEYIMSLTEGQLLSYSINKKHPISFVFDDRPKVIRMWRRRGIFVFNCAQSDEDF